MKFHYLARGIILANGKVLLAHQKGASNTFLPGGHIEDGEAAESALIRELQEELGWTGCVRKFIGAVEHVWTEDGQDNHEINLVFEVFVAGADARIAPRSLEERIEFFWSEPKDLIKHNLLPAPLRDCIMNWNANYNGFWGRIQKQTARE